ncbi:MAG TPA: response regulator transcription factor [Aggregatilineales bacterium]|nr:response regulator transcription factor [Aggregatilineales bacterium]
MRQQTILVVDDEATIREVVRRYLERDGFLVLEAENGKQALDILRDQPLDLVVLDVMLPELDGFSITRRLRGDTVGGEEILAVSEDIPIIMLTARKDELDRVAGLHFGADDYVTKPFSPQELVARVKAVLRRTGNHKPTVSDQPIIFETLRIDPRTRIVQVDSRDIDLTAKEFDLLWHLAKHPRQVFTRAQLLDQIWGYDFYGDASTVTVHVRRLREKIEPDPGSPAYIQTVWGVGYKFSP